MADVPVAGHLWWVKGEYTPGPDAPDRTPFEIRTSIPLDANGDARAAIAIFEGKVAQSNPEAGGVLRVLEATWVREIHHV